MTQLANLPSDVRRDHLKICLYCWGVEGKGCHQLEQHTLTSLAFEVLSRIGAKVSHRVRRRNAFDDTAAAKLTRDIDP